MAEASIRDRLVKLENQRRFLDWFVAHRFWATLSLEELETFAAGGGLPDPVPNLPSNLDTMDRKSLLKLWEDDQRVFRGRSQADREYYADSGTWPEQRGRLHYSMQHGRLFVEWRNEVLEEGVRPGTTTTQEQGASHQLHFGGSNGATT
jgi:hypothetical protein